jgi:hypothetical protein
MAFHVPESKTSETRSRFEQGSQILRAISAFAGLSEFGADLGA